MIPSPLLDRCPRTARAEQAPANAGTMRPSTELSADSMAFIKQRLRNGRAPPRGVPLYPGKHSRVRTVQRRYERMNRLVLCQPKKQLVGKPPGLLKRERIELTHPPVQLHDPRPQSRPLGKPHFVGIPGADTRNRWHNLLASPAVH